MVKKIGGKENSSVTETTFNVKGYSVTHLITAGAGAMQGAVTDPSGNVFLAVHPDKTRADFTATTVKKGWIILWVFDKYGQKKAIVVQLNAGS